MVEQRTENPRVAGSIPAPAIFFMKSQLKNSFFVNSCIVFLTVLGLFQIVGDLFQLPFLKGIGAASVVSPFPKVFCDVRGLETFASTFTLKYYLPDGTVKDQSLTAELYQKIRGPYNRRNVYGVALAYAPRLPEKVWTTIFCYGLKPGGPLFRELQVPVGTQRVEVEIKTKTRGRDDQWLLSPLCD